MRARGLRRTVRPVVQGYAFASRRRSILDRPILAEPPPPPSSEFECRMATADDVESFVA